MLMLRHLEERDAADRLEQAIAAVIREGKSVTYDMKPSRDDPTAMILSGVLMLEHLGELEAAKRLEAAVAHVIREGKSVTYDMKPRRDDPTAVGTQAAADAVIEALD